MIPVVAETREIDRELQVLEAELKRLEAEYNMFFAGRLPRPPWETREPRRCDGQAARSPAHRQLRRPLPVHHAADALRDVHRPVGSRAARARGGRPGPFAQPAKPAADASSRSGRRTASCTSPPSATRCVRWTSCTTCTTAWPRRGARPAQDAIPFHKFAELIKTQVAALKDKGSAEVAFRVAMKDGKVAFTARRDEGG